MEKITGSNVYFRDPGLTKKHLIERINREFRKKYHKGTDFSLVTQQKIEWVVSVIN